MSSFFLSISKLLRSLFLVTLLFLGFTTTSGTVQAAANSILPNYEYTEWVCDPSQPGYDEFLEAIREQKTYDSILATCGTSCSEELLACAVKSGEIKFWMIPHFVNYALDFVIRVAGVLVVLMIVVGGYYYIYGAVTDDKEKGKTIVTYAIGGYVLILTSWFIVNAVLLAVTQ